MYLERSSAMDAMHYRIPVHVSQVVSSGNINTRQVSPTERSSYVLVQSYSDSPVNTVILFAILTGCLLKKSDKN